ncbi:M56 family metallopeptidase [Pontimicrobium sp. SW4]|uniref:M56 family metallopeptidase n=1 Tax=Pontimicrobium sp. SW4 TaxID=3153519 RepID=A0AAU7BT52_9FLAO
MALYLLKFSGCLLIFLAFYKLVLEKENMHAFKRFFLLAALVLSISIPLVTFTQYVDYSPLTFNEVSQDMLIANNPIEIETTTSYTPYIIWSIYLIGVLIFGFKFIRNLYRLNYKIKHNPKQRYYEFTHVLLKDLIVPHTFFNYIFFNKSKFEANQIPEEVFWHEQTHATQKHSIDVVFIEALQVLLWFNPLIYIIKHAIKLNHEFLADQGVLRKGINTNTYQKIILAFSSNATQPQLANAINYSLIKKRFTVMKTQTTKRGVWLRSLVLLPLLAIMLYSFSDTKVIEKTSEEVSDTNYTARSINIEVFNNGTYEIEGTKATKKTFASVINQLHQDITPEIRNQIINVHVNNGKAVLDEDVWFIYNSVIDYGFHRIVTYNQEIIREKGNKPFAITNTDTYEQQKATKLNTQNKYYRIITYLDKDGLVLLPNGWHPVTNLKQSFSRFHNKSKADSTEIELLIHKKSSKNATSEVIDILNSFGTLKTKYVDKLGWETNSRKPNAQQKATKAQIKEYNTIARKYNSMSKNDMVIKKTDIERLKYIYSIMNAEQKKNTEPFPNIPAPPAPKAPRDIEVEEVMPPPPPPIPANATPEQKAKYKKIISEYAKKYPESVTRYKSKSGEIIEEVEVPTNLLPPPPPPPVPHNATPEQKKKYKENIKKYKLAVAESRQNMAKVREAKSTERTQLIEVKEQYAAERKASQEVKLARVAEMKVKQEKLQRIVERQAISEERKAQLVKEKLKHVEERKAETEKRQEMLKKEKLKHVEERKVLAEQKRKHAIAAKVKRQEENIARREMNIPPSPPKSPLDHVIEMAKKDAIFYFEGKEISSDEAIKKIKQGSKINIKSYNKDDKPKVYLSTKPIVVEMKKKN